MKKFTEEELEILKCIANVAWSYVAPDLEGAIKTPASRDLVFEVSVDANRLETFAYSEEEKAVAKKFYKLSWDEMNSFKKHMFPFALYE